MRKSAVLGFSRIFPLIVISAVTLLLVLAPFYHKKSSVKAVNSGCGGNVATNFGISNAESIYNILTDYAGIEINVKYGNFLSSTVRGYLNSLNDGEHGRRVGVVARAVDDGPNSLEYFFNYADGVTPPLLYDFGAYDLEDNSPSDEQNDPVWAASEARDVCDSYGKDTQMGSINEFVEYWPDMYEYTNDHWVIQLQNNIEYACSPGPICYHTPSELKTIAEGKRDAVEDGSSGDAPIWGQLSLDSTLASGYTFDDYVNAIYPSTVDGIFIFNPSFKTDELEDALNNVCDTYN